MEGVGGLPLVFLFFVPLPGLDLVGLLLLFLLLCSSLSSSSFSLFLFIVLALLAFFFFFFCVRLFLLFPFLCS